MKQSIILHFLGTGTILSKSDESCSSVLMETPHEKILVDCGPGTLQQLRRRRIQPSDITQIFVTHFHPDHISDLIPLLFTIVNWPEIPKKIVQVRGPAGFDHFMEGMFHSYGFWLQNGHFQFSQLDTSPVKFENFKVVWCKVLHNSESIGYRFQFNETSVSFSGDSGYCPELITLAENADLAVMECSTPDEKFLENHLTPSQVGEIAGLANPKKLAITHLYPETLVCSPLDTIRKFFKGESFLARDVDKLYLRT